MTTGTEATRTYAFVVDEGTAGRLTHAGLRSRLRKPRFWASYLGIPFGLALISYGTGTWTALVGAVAFLLVFPLLLRRSTIRQVRRIIPVGTRIETTFTDDAFTVRMPTGTSTLLFTGLHELRRRGDGVTFQVGGSRLIQVLPPECFPDEEIARAVAAGADG